MPHISKAACRFISTEPPSAKEMEAIVRRVFAEELKEGMKRIRVEQELDDRLKKAKVRSEWFDKGFMVYVGACIGCIGGLLLAAKKDRAQRVQSSNDGMAIDVQS